MSEEVQKSNAGQSLGVAALILGIVGLLGGLFPCTAIFAVGIILGAIALILGAIGMSKAKNGGGKKGLPMTGLIIGILAIVANIGWYAFIGAAGNALEDIANDPAAQEEFENQMNDAFNQLEEAAEEAEESAE